MSIQFLDLRVSAQSSSDANSTIIPLIAAPLVFGDIGLQVAGVSPDNTGNVRVQLWGFADVSVAVATDIVIEIIKNGDIANPVLTVVTPLPLLTERSIGFSASDFPTALEVAAGQIQYEARIYTSVLNIATIIGARNFSGMAAAGTFTG